MTPDTTKTSQSTIPVPFPLGNTVFTPYSPHIHSKTTKTTNSALHDMHRPRTGPQERSTAAHTRRSNYIDRPAGPGPREPTFVAVPPRLAHCTHRARGATCRRHMDSGRRRTDVVGSDDSTGSGSGGACGGHGVGRDGCAALPARCGRAEVSSEALHVLGHASDAGKHN